MTNSNYGSRPRGKGYPIGEITLLNIIMVFTEKALDCVRWIRSLQERDELPENVAAVASALSTIMHLAQFVEKTTRESENTGVLSMGVYAIASPHSGTCSRANGKRSSSESGQQSLRCKTFVIWDSTKTLAASKSICNTPNNAERVRSQHQPVSLSNNGEILETRPLNGISANDGRNGSRLQNMAPSMQVRLERDEIASDPITQRPTTSREQENLNSELQSAGNTGLHSAGADHMTEISRIPPEISAVCLSLLLEGAGHRSHPLTGKETGYADLHGSELKDAVKLLHKEEKVRIEHSRRQLPSEESSVSREDGKGCDCNNKELLYSSLIPDHLRGRRVSVALVRFGSPDSSSTTIQKERGYNVHEWKEVDLKGIRKPDRNGKDQNFALLCLNLYYFGLNGSAGKALLSLSSNGNNFSKSCKVWGKYSKRTGSKEPTVSLCSGPAHCSVAPTSICTFLFRENENDLEVGAGTVHPRVTYFRGGRVPSSCFLVRFAKVHSFQGTRKCVEGCESTPVLWDRKSISRVRVLGPYNVPIATAILVHSNPWIGPQGETVYRGRKRRLMDDDSRDVAKAILVCDVKLDRKVIENKGMRDAMYPYQEWYDLPLLKTLIPLHFANRKVPQKIEDIATCEVIELLWHGSCIQPL